MLVRYRFDYEKIAMGLLSLTPGLKDYSRLKSELQGYTDSNTERLYLWRADENQDFAGVIGCELTDEFVILRHLAISPNYRGENNSFRMLDELSNKFPQLKIMASVEMTGLITKWQQAKHSSQE